jgi:hypothetical protein
MYGMSATRHSRMLAVLLCFVSIYACCTASLAADTASADSLTPSHGTRTPTDALNSKTSYTVQKGDCIGKILRVVFKLPEAVIFSPQTTRSIQLANPHIKDLNDLQTGEKLFVPSYIMQHMPPQMVSDERSQASPAAPPELAGLPVPLPKMKQGGSLQPAHDYAISTTSDAQSDPIIHVATDETAIREVSLAGADTLQHENKIRRMLIDFVKAFDGYDNTSCIKSLPIENSGTIVMDCSKFPVYEFPWGSRIVMDYGGHLSGPVRETISAQWEHTKIITAGYNENAETIFSRVIDGCGLLKNEFGNRYTVSRDNIQISVSGNWIVYKDHAQKNIFVITISNGIAPPVPEGLQTYLTGLGINLLHLTSTENKPGINIATYSPEHEVLQLPANPVKMTDMILELIGIAPQKNVKTKIIPPNARGIKFEVTIDRKFELAGKTCFIDFKNLSSNIATMLNSHGNRILQIDSKTENYTGLIHELLDFCAAQNSASPAHFQYVQSEKALLELSIPGFLLHTKYGDFLLTNIEIDKNILNFLIEIDVKSIKF